MVCVKCETKLPEGAKVCMNCGTEVKGKEIRCDRLDRVQQLLEKAQELEKEEAYEEAFENYKRVLEIENDREEAIEGQNRVKQEMNNAVYYQTSANNGDTFGRLQLKDGVLVYRTKRGNEARYFVDEIYNVRKCGEKLAFTYSGKRMEIIYGCSKIAEWIKVINHVHNGDYPKRMRRKVVQVEGYILEHLNPMHRMDAVNYYIEQMGVSKNEATNVVYALL